MAVPGVNYAAGAPFVDPTRRVVADGEADAMGAEYVPDAGVASAGAMAAGRRRSRDDPPETEDPGSERLRLAVEEGFRGGESFAFVDMDDDRETDELGDVEPAGEEVDMEKVREDEEEGGEGAEDAKTATSPTTSPTSGNTPRLRRRTGTRGRRRTAWRFASEGFE